ncbi:hypothetical protein Cgig2_009275 [Carnegiea gigantea]|uniref:DDT domain-containing protein n=1 Tax=Carnegiea gigantea TaxID=171969 RepID=A0A9Q1K034_9CARY|nr:hypothetical protein Cgig2_009275 [Carnegiea gigantea]
MAVPSSPAPSQRKNKRSSSEQMGRSETKKEEVPKPSKRTKCPGVRVVGGRIYDSQNGKTCHQCRQKTMDFTAACKNMKLDKQCTIKFCHKCLLNRYGEKAEEMEALDDWKCPKCRGICNCSFCIYGSLKIGKSYFRKKRGHKPTGILVHTAKATGFSSVSELLDVKGPDVCQEKVVTNQTTSPKKSATSPKKLAVSLSTEEPAVVSPKKRGKENSFDGTCNANLNSPPPSSPDENTAKKTKREGLRERVEVSKDNSNASSPRKDAKGGTLRSPRKSEIPWEVTKKEEMMDDGNCGIPAFTVTEETKKEKKLKAQGDASLKPHKLNKDIGMYNKKVEVMLPPGTLLTSVVGVDLLPEDIGHALQFLEFCSTFGEVLDIRKGQAESVLRDIMCGRSRRKGKCSSAIQFLTQLVSFILKDTEEESPTSSPTNDKDPWIHSLKKCLSASECELEDIPEDCFDKGCAGYEMLQCSQKLRLLTFLCDEALYTTEMRNWIEEQNVKFVEQVKEAKEGLNAAKEKEKLIKRKLQDEVAKVIIAKNGAPLTISEHDSIISKIKAEAEQAHAEMLEAMDLVPKKKQRSDAVRTEAVFLDVNGHAYWRLNCISGLGLLCQDIGDPEQITSNDKWFTFSSEETKVIEKHISSQRIYLDESEEMRPRGNPRGRVTRQVRGGRERRCSSDETEAGLGVKNAGGER